MKTKLFTFVLLLLAITTTNAQSQLPLNVDVRYHGEVQLGFGAGVGALAVDRVNIQTIQGVMIGDYISTGLGLGVNIIPSYVFGYSSELYVPIFINTKGYLPISQKSSLFFSFDIGGFFGVSEGVSGLKGLMVTPALGVSILNRVNLSLGYEVQKLSESGLSINMNAVSIKLGYRL